MTLSTYGIDNIGVVPGVCDQVCRRLGKFEIFAAGNEPYFPFLNRVFAATKVTAFTADPESDQFRWRKGKAMSC